MRVLTDLHGSVNELPGRGAGSLAFVERRGHVHLQDGPVVCRDRARTTEPRRSEPFSPIP